MIHIFHHYDADGYASAAVIIRHYREIIAREGLEIKCYSCKHGNPMSFSGVDIDKDKVFIVDYSFTDPRDVESVEDLVNSCMNNYKKIGFKDADINKINYLKKHIVWIDHHASSQDLIDEHTNLRLLATAGCVHPENIYAGCMLTWLYLNCPGYKLKGKDLNAIKYYISENCPIWVQFVDDYDKWAHKMDHSSDFVTGVNCTNGGLWNNFLNPDGSYATYVSKNADGITKKFIKRGKVINEYRKGENEKALKGAGFATQIICDETILDVLAINKSGNSLIFGDYIKDVDAVITYSFDGKLWNYSIFSYKTKEFPVNKVAEMYKERYGITGGGHQHAAGWATEKCIFGWDDSISNVMVPFKEWLKRKEESDKSLE